MWEGMGCYLRRLVVVNRDCYANGLGSWGLFVWSIGGGRVKIVCTFMGDVYRREESYFSFFFFKLHQ